MPIIPVASSTTLLDVRSSVRALAGIVSEQESGILDSQVEDAIHDGIKTLRATPEGKTLDPFYATPVDIALTDDSGIFVGDISALDVSDLTKVELFNSATGRIPFFVDEKEFNNLRSMYATTDLVGTGIATIVNKQVRIFSGETLATVRVTYIRNPVRPTADTDKLDIPEQYILAVKQQAVKVVVALKQKGNVAQN